MTSVLEPPTVTVDISRREGGLAARQAVTRWAWRLFRREWRQQLLVLSLILFAVAALVVGATASTDSPPPANAGFGTAQYQANISGTPTHDGSRLSSLSHTYGTLDVIENDATPVPGSLLTFDFRVQNPHGPFGQPMLQLLSGRYPTLPGEVAITQGVAQDFNLRVGSVWHFESKRWLVEGMVQNPQSLLDEFALVAPGQLALTSSTQITALFDDHTGVAPHGNDITSAANANANANANAGIIDPATITLLLAVIGMILIGLVAIAGFTVLAQRRLRSIGMLQSLGGTDRHVRLVVRANGAVVGIVGTVLGAALGFALWAAYRPHLESSSHHVIGLFQLPWTVLLIAGLIAMVTPFLAASRPARTITKVPIVKALSGRPAPPKPAHRSAIPGLVLLVACFALLGLAGSQRPGGGGSPAAPLLGGFLCLIAAIILLAPIAVGLLGRLGRLPVTARLALRDLARYRARSGSALAAISLGVLIAVIVCVAASARYSDVLDYAGPNLSSNQLVVNADSAPPPGSTFGPKGSNGSVASTAPIPSMATQTSVADGIARSLGAAHGAVPLEQAPAGLQYGIAEDNLQFNGQIYVATPQLLKALGISQSQVNPRADFLTMRAGLDTMGNMQMVWGNASPGQGGGPGGPVNGTPYPCPASSCLGNPVIQYLPQLPSGTSAPNTLLTEHAISQLHLQDQASVSGWLISSAGPLTAAQISEARTTASTAQLTIETKNDEPSSWEVVDWATGAGIALALAILVMTVGLIRAETASDLRTLAATGSSSWSRRSITAATAGGLAFLGMLLGAAGGYLAGAGFFQGGRFGQSVFGNLSHVPLPNLLIIVVGLPVAAAVGGFVFSGRQPSLVSRQPIE